jgi:hypothetical protein
VNVPTATQNTSKHIIDCHYIENTTDKENNKIIGVECKHIQKELRPDDLDQLDKNIQLVRPLIAAGTPVNLTTTPNKRLKRIEYVFSSKAAAELNKQFFTQIGKFTVAEAKTLFLVYYIDESGIKQQLTF